MILQRKNRTKGGWEGESELRFILNSWFAGLWKLASPKSAGWFGKLEIQKIADATVEGCLLAEFLLVQGGQSFVPFKPSTNWMKPTHIMEGDLLYSMSSNLNINFRRTSLGVQWLRLHGSTAGGVGMGSLPGWGTKISPAAQHGQKKKRILPSNLHPHRNIQNNVWPTHLVI